MKLRKIMIDLNKRIFKCLEEGFFLLFSILCFTSCSYKGEYNNSLPTYIRNVEYKAINGESTLNNASSAIRALGNYGLPETQ